MEYTHAICQISKIAMSRGEMVSRQGMCNEMSPVASENKNVHARSGDGLNCTAAASVPLIEAACCSAWLRRLLFPTSSLFRFPAARFAASLLREAQGAENTEPEPGEAACDRGSAEQSLTSPHRAAHAWS